MNRSDYFSINVQILTKITGVGYCTQLRRSIILNVEAICKTNTKNSENIMWFPKSKRKREMKEQ